MATISLTGADTVIIDGRVIRDLADGDAAALTFPNDIANVQTGKNGNAIYGLNESGKQAEFKLRVIRGSSDDKYLNGRMVQQENDFSSFVLLNGEFIKKVGDGKGNTTKDTYIASFGVFTKRIEAKTNVNGETEQSVAIYTMKFANAPRALT
jgi:hypothetical protein